MVRLYRTYIIIGETRCAGCLCTSPGWFKHTKPYRTFSNYISSGDTRCARLHTRCARCVYTTLGCITPPQTLVHPAHRVCNVTHGARCTHSPSSVHSVALHLPASPPPHLAVSLQPTGHSIRHRYRGQMMVWCLCTSSRSGWLRAWDVGERWLKKIRMN